MYLMKERVIYRNFDLCESVWSVFVSVIIFFDKGRFLFWLYVFILEGKNEGKWRLYSCNVYFDKYFFLWFGLSNVVDGIE